MAAAAVAGLSLFGLGAAAGWSSPPSLDPLVPSEIGFYDLDQVITEGRPVPDDLTSVLVTVFGQSCDGEWTSSGFLVHGMVLIPGYHPSSTSTVRLSAGSTSATIAGTNQDPLSMIIAPQASLGEGLVTGRISVLRPGSTLYQLSAPNAPAITVLTVDSVRSYRNGALTLRFEDPSDLVPGAPILNKDGLIVAFVNPSGTNALTIDLVESSLSNAKLAPSFSPVACPTEGSTGESD